MVDISAPREAVKLVADILREAPGAIVGGFLAYVAHETYHTLWKRPAHLVIRRLFRRRAR